MRELSINEVTEVNGGQYILPPNYYDDKEYQAFLRRLFKQLEKSNQP